MARRRSNSDGWLDFVASILGLLFSVSLFVGFVVWIIGMLVETDAILWVIVLIFCVVIVVVTVNLRHRKQEGQLLHERGQEAKRLHDQRLAEEERQKRLREQEEQRRREEEERRFRALELADIDNMSSGEFEQYVGKLMKRRGHKTKVIGKAGDMGVDVVAQNGAKKYAVQVKRYNQPVSRRAVSDAVAGKEHYGCNAAMVVTNNYFTKGAMDLARSTKCQLVDRDTLADWIVDSRKETTKERKNKGSHTRVESKNHPTPLDLILRDLIAQRKRTNAQNSQPSSVPPQSMRPNAPPANFLNVGEDRREQSQEGKIRVENERTPPAPSPPPTTLAIPDNTHSSYREHLAKKRLIEQLNQHPLNQKARELLKQMGEPDYPQHLSILLLLHALAHNPEGVDENKVWKETFPYSLIDLLEPLREDRETMNLLLGQEEDDPDAIQITDQAIEAVQTPQEMLELLAGTLGDLAPVPDRLPGD